MAVPFPSDLTRPVVLVGEDDHALSRVIAIALEHDGFAVTPAYNGAELERRIERIVAGVDARGVDLVIADERMPTLGGLAVLSHLRRADWAIPFILITGYCDGELRAEARRLGALLVLDKPFDLDTLRAVARAVAMPEAAPC
jgi:DNA-binding response OmpR family regulator